MTYQDFTGSAAARQRYWARSHVGWSTIAGALPNAGHRAVARLQRAGLIDGVITQNVDGLHQAAGAHPVIQLHGGLDRVVCLGCRARSEREELHARLRAANPQLGRRGGEAMKPDGDVELAEQDVRSFRVVDCLDCGGGPLKPDVVFFGENVPAQRVADSYELVEASRTLLVLGSSLTVASGFRFIRRAVSLRVAVVIVNAGETRGDPYARVKIDAPLGAVLTDLARRLGHA